MYHDIIVYNHCFDLLNDASNAKDLASFNNSEEIMLHVSRERPGVNPGPWCTKRPLHYTAGSVLDSEESKLVQGPDSQNRFKSVCNIIRACAAPWWGGQRPRSRARQCRYQTPLVAA